MTQMTAQQLDTFLAKTRQAILLRTNADGTANGAALWYDWDGTSVRMFSMASAPKVTGLKRDPRISVLITNDVDEPPSWVRFDGTAVLDWDDDATSLAVDVLAPRYWDLSNPGAAEVVEQWRSAPAGALVTIRLDPERVVSYSGQ
ncbi:MAG: pyridoxamine 5'-phosphate oxidase family protein [Actinomycetota bacterium]